jgi:hypothetical protein
MGDKFIYAGKEAEVTSAEEVKGILIRSGKNYFFRVYQNDGEFTDYDISHDELSITIDTDAMASFYTDGKNFVLDHSPSVLGLKSPK